MCDSVVVKSKEIMGTVTIDTLTYNLLDSSCKLKGIKTLEKY